MLLAAAPVQLGHLSQSRSRFNAEFDFLLACCMSRSDDDLAGQISAQIDWKAVLASAEHHRLLPALHNAIGPHAFPLKTAVRSSALNHAWRALQLTAQLARIAHDFECRGIEFLAYKGPALAQLLYGSPAMRQFGDIDVLVRPREVAQAKAALAELGYRSRLCLSPRQEKSYIRSACEHVFDLETDPHPLELHWSIVPRFYSIDFDIDALFARSQQLSLDGVVVRTLGNEDLMLVLCVHAAKHEWSQLGMIRDIFTLAQFDLDWGWILREARRLRILKIVQVSLLLTRSLLHYETPDIATETTGGTASLITRVIHDLRQNIETDTDDLAYFRRQIQYRERWFDRVRFVARLATTPSVEEWKSVPIPDRLSVLYQFIRAWRLLKRFPGRNRRREEF